MNDKPKFQKHLAENSKLIELDFWADYDVKWVYFEWRLSTLKPLLYCFLG